MKLLLLATLTFLPCLALAQSTTATPPSTGTEPEQHHHHKTPEQQLARLTKKLGLDATQQGQIGPILTSRDKQITTILQNASLTKEQKHAQIRTLIQDTNPQIESHLNSTQLTEFKALHKHHGGSA